MSVTLKLVLGAVALTMVLVASACAKSASRLPPSPLSAAPPETAVMSARVDPAALPAALGYADLARLLADPAAGIRLLDVRTAEEYAAGRIPGAELAPYDSIGATTFTEPDKAAPVVVYCRSGRRSAIAKATLESLGYTNVSDFGGIDNWKGTLER